MNKVAINLMGKLLNKIPSKRLGVNNIQEIKDHEFFKSINWDMLSQKLIPEGGIFDETELFQAMKGQYLVDESINYEDQAMDEVEHKINFHDEDYKSEEEYSPLGTDYNLRKYWFYHL